MILFHDTMPTVVQRTARRLLLASVLLVLTPGTHALNTPQRSAAPSMVKSTAETTSGYRHSKGNRTYLAMVGPAALRFADAAPLTPAEPPPPPELPKPIVPPASTGPDVIAAIPATTANTTVKPTTDKTEVSVPNSSSDPKGPTPVSILPDDTKTEIRAEDVLPFFQFPGIQDNSTTAIPFSTLEPVRAKPSSATYRQQ